MNECIWFACESINVAIAQDYVSLIFNNLFLVLSHLMSLVSFYTPENVRNQRFSHVFREYKRRLVVWNGLKFFKDTIFWKTNFFDWYVFFSSQIGDIKVAAWMKIIPSMVFYYKSNAYNARKNCLVHLTFLLLCFWWIIVC